MNPISECRACKSPKLAEFLDLGKQYLSDFRDDNKNPPKYPLVAVLCEDCKLAQLKHTTPPYEMYHDRYGFKSGVSDSIRADLDSVVIHGFQYVNDPEAWLDIGSNDGTLLSFVPDNIYRVGVDPVAFLCEEAREHADIVVNDFFTADSVGGRFDVITTVSCFYDMPDPSQFVQDVESVLSIDGVWVIQQNYLLTTMELGAVDNFCHEHLGYYTLLSLEALLAKYDLEVNEVLLSPVNGGSIRTVVSRKGIYEISDSVYKQREVEQKAGLEHLAAYQDFSNKAGIQLQKLNQLVRELKRDNQTIVILAASTRGATIWQSADVTSEYVDFAVERNPAKVGRQFSAIKVPIVSEEDFRKSQPDYAIVGPWFLIDEIAEREAEYVAKGGRLIVPLPEVKVL